LRGVRFSKVISYGNACDINETDLLEYLADDPDTKIIALYIEGVKDGRRFRRALEKATAGKAVVLLKGGTSEGGARAVAGHTASLAGNRATWNALCKQLGIISVSCVEEMIDVLITLLFLPVPKGRNALLFGAGGGASVLIADQFESRGLRVPAIPREMVNQICEFTPIAGNILRNPVDYSQAMFDMENVVKTFAILAGWDGADFLVTFVRTGQFTASRISDNQLRHLLMSRFPIKQGQFPRPIAMVIEPSIIPEEAEAILHAILGSVSSGLPVYFSFASAATAINLVLSHAETQSKRAGTL
jgi:acyl-CoA synthetase (NDP forming)